MSSPVEQWDSSYRADDAPPWDIGRPQPIFAGLAERGLLTGRLLDAGCGTGEHALLAARAGASVTGVDLSETAIARARDKAASQALAVTFEVGDILEMPLPDAAFDTVIDSGLFHVFDDEGRSRYVEVLRRALRVGGTCYLACFSDRQPGDWGPRRVSERELRDAFAAGWTPQRVEPATFDINPFENVATIAAWLAVIERTSERG